jgi:hypothetical protein
MHPIASISIPIDRVISRDINITGYVLFYNSDFLQVSKKAFQVPKAAFSALEPDILACGLLLDILAIINNPRYLRVANLVGFCSIEVHLLIKFYKLLLKLL